MTTTAPDTVDPILWAGTGESLVADMRHRELLVFGTRDGRRFSLERAFTLEGWEDRPLVEILLEGPSAVLRLVELEDLTGVVPKTTFDLPAGAGFGLALYAFEQVVRGFGSVLERAATAKTGFHLLPRLFARVWGEIGDGNPVCSHSFAPFVGSREAVTTGDAWKRGLPASIPHLSEQKTKPRHQLHGHHVLDGELGMCPECGGSMVKKPDGKRICRNVLESDVGVDYALSPEEEALLAQMTGGGAADDA